MNTLIIGANGQIGRLLVQKLVRDGERPRAMVRSEDQARELRQMGAEPVIGDLEGEFDAALQGCDKLVFTAGSGPDTGADKTILVDMWGAMKAVDAAAEEGIDQFVMVSSRGAQDPDAGPAKIRHYTVCKKVADDYLLDSELPCTILRPGRLINDPASHRVTTKWPEDPQRQWISREDVANAIAFCLYEPATIDRIYPLFHGDQPLEKALV